MNTTFYQIENEKLINFMEGFSAAIKLKNRAAENGFFIEYVCLSRSIIDALLRIGLVFQYLLKQEKNSFPSKYIFQDEKAKTLSEKAIYIAAKEKGIISESIHNSLLGLYIKRNQVVHRYIISRITTNDVLMIASEYDSLIDQISNQVKKLELEHIQKDTGFCHLVSGPEGEMLEYINESIEKMANKKHANHKIAGKQ